MGHILSQISSELHRGSSPLHEHNGDGRPVSLFDEDDAFVGEGFTQAVLAATIGDSDAVDPGRATRPWFIEQYRIQAGKQCSCFLARCARRVGYHVE